MNLRRHASHNRRMHRKEFEDEMMTVGATALSQTKKTGRPKPIGPDKQQKGNLDSGFTSDARSQALQTRRRRDGAAIIAPAFGSQPSEFKRVTNARSRCDRGGSAPAVQDGEVGIPTENQFHRSRLITNENLKAHGCNSVARTRAQPQFSSGS